MSIVFHCQECLTPYEVGEELSGRNAQCSQCGHMMRIPLAAGESPSAQPPQPPGAQAVPALEAAAPAADSGSFAASSPGDPASSVASEGPLELAGPGEEESPLGAVLDQLYEGQDLHDSAGEGGLPPWLVWLFAAVAVVLVITLLVMMFLPKPTASSPPGAAAGAGETRSAAPADGDQPADGVPAAAGERVGAGPRTDGASGSGRSRHAESLQTVDQQAQQLVGGLEGPQRARASRELRALGAGAEPAVIACLGHHDPTVRREAAEILRQIGGQASVQPLALACKDPDQAVALAAAAALRRLDPQRVDRLTIALLDLASDSLMEQSDALADLAKLPVEPQHRAQVVAMVQPWAFTGTSLTRDPAIQALLHWDRELAVGQLLKELEQEDPQRRRQAAAILGQLQEERAVAPLIRLLPSDRYSIGEALQAMGPIAEQLVLRLLRSPDVSLRRQGCVILGAIGTSRSLPALQQVRQREAGSAIASAAEHALQSIEKAQRTPVEPKLPLPELPAGPAAAPAAPLPAATPVLDPQREALARLEDLGAVISGQARDQDLEVDLSLCDDVHVGLRLLQRFPMVRRVKLAGGQLDSQSSVLLGELKRLQELDLSCGAMDDRQLPLLAGLTQLRTLLLGNHQGITDKGLTHLGTLKQLQLLGLIDTGVTDAGMAALEALTGLQAVYVTRTQVTSAGAVRLKKALPQVDVIR